MNKKLLVIACLALFTGTTYGQYMGHRWQRSYNDQNKTSKKFLQRYSFGYIYPIEFLDLVQKYTPTGATIAKRYEKKSTSKSGWGLSDIYSIPIVKFDKNSALGIDLPVDVTYNKWEVGPTDLTTENLNATCLQMRVGFGFKYMYGGEVSLSTESNGVFAIGAGFMPSLFVSNYIEPTGVAASRPYIMAEAGIHAGITFKLRATMFIGQVILNDHTVDLSDDTNDYYSYNYPTSGKVNVNMAMNSGFN